MQNIIRPTDKEKKSVVTKRERNKLRIRDEQTQNSIHKIDKQQGFTIMTEGTIFSIL